MKVALILAVLVVAVSAQDPPPVAAVCPNDNALPYVNCKTCSKYAVGPNCL
jgi:hypothetical protein